LLLFFSHWKFWFWYFGIIDLLKKEKANRMTTILIKSAQVIDIESAHHGKQTDIYIKDGMIEAMGTDLEVQADKELNASGLVANTGWLDILSYCGEPGEEWKEDLNSLSRAAQSGGFTHVAVLAGNHPHPDHAAAISALQKAGEDLPVHILPLGNITQQAQGKDMTEFHDMAKAGAVGFSDGDHPISDTGLISRIMEYNAGLKLPVLFFPFDRKLAPGGRMHEGVQSASLGLKGIPAVSESAALEQILQIASWLKVPVRIIRISSAESVDLLRKAKAAGIDVKAAVPAFNLLFTDENLASFDENYKVLPPYRSERDRMALWQGLTDGTIDAVMSNHHAQDIENKAVEFEYAGWGASAVQTVLQAVTGGGKPDLNLIAATLSSGPRKLMGLPRVSLNPGQPADITLFSPTTEWIFEPSFNYSKGVNQPLLGKTLKGSVTGTVKAGTWYANPMSVKNA
jgi:dihydroorotase